MYLHHEPRNIEKEEMSMIGIISLGGRREISYDNIDTSGISNRVALSRVLGTFQFTCVSSLCFLTLTAALFLDFIRPLSARGLAALLDIA